MLLYPNAKINLGLNVIRKRSDGYHDIETLFYPVPDLCDILEIVHADTFRMQVYGAQVEGENLCEKAWKLMHDRFGIPPVAIHLYKKIPMGAGLGGGSSDAAFTLKGLNTFFKIGLPDTELCALAATLGSDCAFFIFNRPMLARGRGEILTPLDFTLGDHVLRIYPQEEFVSTREAYASLTPREPVRHIDSIVKLPVAAWRGLLVNDFEETVFARHPRLAEVRDALYAGGALYAAMSGSGSALYAIY